MFWSNLKPAVPSRIHTTVDGIFCDESSIDDLSPTVSRMADFGHQAAGGDVADADQLVAPVALGQLGRRAAWRSCARRRAAPRAAAPRCVREKVVEFERDTVLLPSEERGRLAPDE